MQAKDKALDLLREMLYAGRAPSLQSMLVLAPEEPLGPPEGLVMIQKRGVGWVCGQRRRWPKSIIRRREEYSGYQPGPQFLESMKYCHGFGLPEHAMPDEHAPLASFVRKRIQQARAKWCGQIASKRTTLQFADWLRLHLDHRTAGDGGPLWPDHPGGWAESFQLLRLAYGLPRFPPSNWRPA